MKRVFLELTKALADENRVRIVCALRRGELCACQIVALLALAPSTVSKHLDILRQAQLIEHRKQGRWMYYRVAGETAPDQVRRTLRWVFEANEHDPGIQADVRRLKTILRLDPEALCCALRERKPIAAERM